MSPSASKKPTCPACKQGVLHPTVRQQTFTPRGRTVVVELLASRCDHCNQQITRSAQHDENLVRLAARKAQYGDDTLMGEEIVRLRKCYGLTLQATAKIFGKGKATFARYENEMTYPDLSTTRLMQAAIEQPNWLKWLADKAGVELPLWKERCEDAAAAGFLR